MQVVESAAAASHRLPRRVRRTRLPDLASVDLKLGTYFRAMRAESFALTALCVYMTFEYLRPQGMFPVIDVIPWGLTTIVICTLAALAAPSGASGLNIIDALCGLFFVVLMSSMLTAYDPSASFAQWLTPVSHALMFFSVRAILTNPNRLLLFTISFAIINFKFSQYSARAFFRGGGSAMGAGWFSNTGELGMEMGIMFFVTLCLVLALKPFAKSRRRWLVAFAVFPGTAFLAVLGSGSRASQLGVAVAAALMLIKPPQLLRKLIALGALVAAVAVLLPESQKERFRSAGDDKTSQSRIAYWDIGKAIIADNPMGVGYANWVPYYSRFYRSQSVIRRVEVSHNSYIDAFVELGYHGGGLFLLLLATSFVVNFRTQFRLKHRVDAASVITRSVARGTNLSLLATCIAAFFMSVLYYPVFWLAFAMTSAAYQVSRGLTGAVSTRSSAKPKLRASRSTHAAAIPTSA